MKKVLIPTKLDSLATKILATKKGNGQSALEGPGVTQIAAAAPAKRQRTKKAGNT